MKVNRLKVFWIVLLAATMAISAVGRGGPAKEQPEASKDTETPPVLSELTYWVQIVSQVSATMKSYNEIEAYKELERITGVKVDFQHPPQGQQATEQFNLMMTSDKLPDVIEYSWAGYPGTGEGDQDGKIIKLNDLIDQYAPNLKRCSRSIRSGRRKLRPMTADLCVPVSAH